MKKPLVAIVGRPNVGKSTLFNRILGRRDAIVEDESGITRDRHYGAAAWEGRGFLLVDTGGILPDPGQPMLRDIRRQAMLAVEEADLVLFLLDAREGLVPADRDLARDLRASGRRVLFVANKVDGPEQEAQTAEFFELGADELLAVSALHGRGLSDVLDRIIRLLPEAPAEFPSDAAPRIAVVGRPNAGKSTLINALLGKERLLVSPVAGTTRDAIDTVCRYHNRPYRFVDTAGLRRRARSESGVEYFSMLRTLRAIDRADLALILVDASEGFTEQDQKIAGLVHDAGKGTLILLNKWDLTARSDLELRRLTDAIRHSAWFLRHAPVLSISALTRQRVTKIFPAVDRIMAERRRRIPTGELNRFVEAVQREKAPPLLRRRPVRIRYITQAGIEPPRFVIFANRPEGLTPAYRRFIERRLREEFGFDGTPVRFFVRKRQESA